MTDTAPLVLYGMGSPNVRKVVIMLEELGLPYELRHVAVMTGEQFTPAFLAMNPVGKVPVLLDPRLGRPLAESAAIMFWLAERCGALLPTEGPDRYEVMQWVMTQMSLVGPMLGQLNHFQRVPRDEAYSLGRYQSQASKVYRLLDDRLAARDWLAGEAYSIADIATFPWADYLEKHRFDPPSFPALARWRERIASRPAVVRSAQRMKDAFEAAFQDSLQQATKADMDRFYGRTESMPDVDFKAAWGR